MLRRPKRCERVVATYLQLSCVVIALLATSSRGEITSTTSAVTNIPPPPSVMPGALESNTEVYAFDELQNLTLASDLAVDTSAAGTYDCWLDLTPGVIAAGTSISSHLLHADRAGSCGRTTLEGSVTFGSDIIGVIVLGSGLNKTDAALGAIDTDYPSGWASFCRGAELFCNQDYLVLEPDLRTLQVHFSVWSAVDQIRVLTYTDTDTPEPATLSILALGVLPVIASSRRQQRRLAA